jgi:hypothetical protein
MERRAGRGTRIDRSRWPYPQSASWRRLLEHLDRVHADGGWKSYREIAAATRAAKRQILSFKTVAEVLRGQRRPIDEVQLAALVAALGGGQDEIDAAVDLHQKIEAHEHRRVHVTWTMAGLDGRGHFVRRALGQRNAARSGDLFRGRGAALAVVRGWLTAAVAPGLPLIVTGQPGAGKSALVARSVLDAERDRVGPGLAWHARSGTYRSFLAAAADMAGVAASDNGHELIESMRHLPLGRVCLLVVDALDEMYTDDDRDQTIHTLMELAALPSCRVVVATRRLSVGNRYAHGSVLTSLGATSDDDENLIDLDTDRFFEPEGLASFVTALLRQDGAQFPGPPGRAWTAYRNDAGLTDRVVAVIAERAERNYLVAALVAHSLSIATTTGDPDASTFDSSNVPATVGEALTKYLRTLPEVRRAEVRALLVALAYSRGRGLDDETWLAFATALGYPVIVADLDRLRDSAAADYLLEAVRAADGSITVRLYHQALADELVASRRNRASDEDVLLDALRRPGTEWRDATPYARAYAAEHATACHRLPELIADAHFLAVADLPRLLPLLPAIPPAEIAGVTAALRRAANRAADLPPERRIRLLAVTAAHLGLADLQRRFEAASDGTYRLLWAHSLGASHRPLTHNAAGSVRWLQVSSTAET